MRGAIRLTGFQRALATVPAASRQRSSDDLVQRLQQAGVEPVAAIGRTGAFDPYAARRLLPNPTFDGEAADIQRDSLATANAQSEVRPPATEHCAHIARMAVAASILTASSLGVTRGLGRR